MRPFDLLPTSLQKILVKLEDQDRKEREAKLDRMQRLRQIPRDTGEFLYQFLTSFVPQFPNFLGLEIGSSGGYSTLWQGMALLASGHGKLISLDHDPKKYRLAYENINTTEINQYITLIQGDAKEYLKKGKAKYSYVFLDAEKEDYLEFFNLLTDHVSSGTVLIADNVISHKEYLNDFLASIQRESKVSSSIFPVGKGLAFVRWI